MPLVGAEYQERSQEEILAFLESELREEFGRDIDLTQSSAFRTFADALSGVDADEVEPALKQVHDAAFLDSAEGENLEKLVAIIGISRRSAVHATGIVEFDHGEIATSEYTITNGTVIQTDSDDPVRFETTELVTITPFDDFESGSLAADYSGDQSDFAVVDGSSSSDPSPADGSYELQSTATNGAKVFKQIQNVARGSHMQFHTYLQDTDATANAVAGNLFGVLDTDNYYRIRIDESGEHAIEIQTASGTTTLKSDTNVSPPSDEWLRNEVDWEGEDNGRIVSRLYDSNDNLLSEIVVTGESEIDNGGFGFESLDGSENKYWDLSGETAVQADARAREGGPRGNIGANTLTVLPSVPSGVQSVTNPFAMGDDDHKLTSTIEFTTGRPRETDEELRDRAQISEGRRGDATVPALIAEISSLPEAESVSVYENKTNNDNTGSGGLPPKSFEVVYYGSDPKQLIAERMFDVKGFTARDHGGANGTAVSETVEASNNQVFTMNWSEPTPVQIDMTLDIVVNDEFVGKDELRDSIVSYVGGTKTDGTSELGTGAGTNIYVDQIEDIVTGPDDTGVIGISNYSFTPSITTDSNGLEVVSIGSNETAQTNGEDGSINFNITRV
jgi:uncharacterized phage protein gp47/JayE